MAITDSKPLEIIHETVYDGARGQAAQLSALEEGADYRLRVLRFFVPPEERAHEHWVRIAHKGPVKGILSKHADVSFIPLTDDALPQPELAETRKVLADGTVALKLYEGLTAYGIPGRLLEFGYVVGQDDSNKDDFVPVKFEPLQPLVTTF